MLKANDDRLEKELALPEHVLKFLLELSGHVLLDGKIVQKLQNLFVKLTQLSIGPLAIL